MSNNNNRKGTGVQSSGQLLNQFMGNTALKPQKKATSKPTATQNEPLAVVYKRPFKNDTTIAATMHNYRVFRDTYNESLLPKNKEVKRHNSNVKQFLQENPLTYIQKAFIANFKRKYNRLFTQEYNNKVLDFCNTYGLCLEQKRHQGLKDHHEKVFHQYTMFTASQIRTRNRYDEGLKLPPSSLKPLQINYTNVIKHKRDGYKIFTCTLKTLKDRTKRLREAGAISYYQFVNSKNPVKMMLNPEILVITDVLNPKKYSVENQLLTLSRGKKLHNNSVSTRTYKKTKKKEIVDNNFKIRKRLSSLDNLLLRNRGEEFYKNTNVLDTEKKETPRPADFLQSPASKTNNISSFLGAQIENKVELAQKVAHHEYKEHAPIDEKLLKCETMYGKLLQKVFRILIIQEIIKYAAQKLYSDRKIYLPEWQKHINLWLDTLFTQHTYSKTTLLAFLVEYKWRIDKSARFFDKNKHLEIGPPSYFFNPHNKHSSQLCFAITKQHYTKELRRLEKQDKTIKQQKIKGRKNMRELQKQDKLNRAKQKFFNGKYTHDQFYNYLKNNLGTDVLDQLPKHLKTA